MEPIINITKDAWTMLKALILSLGEFINIAKQLIPIPIQIAIAIIIAIGAIWLITRIIKIWT